MISYRYIVLLAASFFDTSVLNLNVLKYANILNINFKYLNINALKSLRTYFSFD